MIHFSPILAHGSSCNELLLDTLTSNPHRSTDLILGSRVSQTTRALRARLKAHFSNEKNLQLQLWEQLESNDSKAKDTKKKLEDTLLYGKIISMRSVDTTRDVKFVVFENGIEAVWKPEGDSDRARPMNEVAAYVVDNTLGLNLVPITILRRLNGVRGSMQVRITGAKEKGVKIPAPIKLLDLLVDNYDRHANLNWLTAPNGRIVAIDHDSYTFGRHGSTNIPSLLKQIQSFNDEIDSLNEELNKLISQSEKLQLAEAIKGWVFSRDYSLQIKKDYQIAIQSRPNAISKLDEISTNEWRRLLTPYLDSDQIDGFLNRRLELLIYFEQINRTGEISLTH